LSISELDKEEVMGKIYFYDIKCWFWDNFLWLFWVILIIIIAVGSLTFGILYKNSQEVLTGTIESTVVDRGNTYFVFQLDDGTKQIFENEDTIWFLKFNSGNLLMELKAGNSYQVLVAGWRVPFFSMYRNIITILERR
jgi:hypothetical protein